MTTDIENELRELFRDKVGDAPVVAPEVGTTPPREVLRRGRLHQIGTVAGSAAIAFAIVAGSAAGLNSLLRGGDTAGNPGDYEVFERTATIEAFTVTSPSDWFLTTRSSGFPTSVDGGSPILQLSNIDLGLGWDACEEGLPPGGAALSVVFTGGHIIDSDPYGPWPTAFREYANGPCGGEGEYAYFTVSGWSLVAWVGSGERVSESDRASLMAAVRSISVAARWEPTAAGGITPAYVIAGGVSEDGDGWRLELRPSGENVELLLEAAERGGSAADFTVPQVPVESCCAYDDGFGPVAFGAVSRSADGVGFRSTDGRDPIPGTIVPLPPTMPFDFDLFFIEGTDGLTGDVVATGLDELPATPSPTAEPSAGIVSLSGGHGDHTWIVRFTGSFDDGTACIRVRADFQPFDPLCPGAAGLENTLAGRFPSVHGWLTSYYLRAGSVPLEVQDIRFLPDDGSGGRILELQCTTGPVGWTDKKVCAMTLPGEGSGTFEYLDAEGNVVFDEGEGWDSATAEPQPVAVDPVHGGSYWAVYAWLGSVGDRGAEDVSAMLLQDFGIEAFPGDLSCDQGAAEALGTDAEQRIAVYFETQEDAQDFASTAGLLGHEADPVIARVTTYCLD